MSGLITRRAVLGGMGAGFSSCLLPASTMGSARQNTQSLAMAAQKAGIMFGASASKEIFENPHYADLYRAQVRLLTTDIAMKFDHIRWREGAFDFDEADRLLAFARQNDLQLRGHTLIWNENAPDWLKKRSLREIETVFDEHIDKVAGRYRGQLHSIDVVNEPFWPGHGKSGGYRTGPWLEAMGSSYVKRAFVRTKKADPEARLVLNEAHCERNDGVGRKIRKGMLRLVDELLDAGVHLDAVGLQGHLQSGKAHSDKVFADFLWQLHARGLNIYISEFDIEDSAYGDDVRKRDRQAGARTYQFFSEVLKVPSVKAVICWQLSDRYSWVRNMALEENPHTKRLPRPLPFDERQRQKPIYAAMIRAFRERRI